MDSDDDYLYDSEYDDQESYSDDDDDTSANKEDDATNNNDDSVDSDDGDGDGDGDGVDDDDLPASQKQKNYTTLSEDDIRKRQEDGIDSVSTVLSISKFASCLLLHRYKWNVNDVNEAWFADEDRVRKAAGLFEKTDIEFSNTDELIICKICFESYPVNKMKAADCVHPYCYTCWTGYITTSINDGPGCLTLRCPDPSCDAAVTQNMIDLFASDEDKEKYHRYIIRSYVEGSRKRKWCPAPGCDCAVEFDHFGSGNYDNYDVCCICSYCFCWNCTEETHRPVDCETVRKWIVKNSAESENTNWILANSKPCPKCKRPIEKNHGCMHMTCTPPCSFEFCWLCLGAWTNHGSLTGGYYACNRYEAAKQEGSYDEDERKREAAKCLLERYTHYYERWASNHKSRSKALADLRMMETDHLVAINQKYNQSMSQLGFIVEAWGQIVECRRVLKWTYAYGYYLDPEEECGKSRLFEYLQGEAEAGLERLHQCAEKELKTYLDDEQSTDDFLAFRTKLAGLTRVTRNYFENLVKALENGLSDVDSHGEEQGTELKNLGSSS